METDDDEYECDGMDGGIGREVDDESSDEEEFDIDKRKSAVYKNLVSSPECRKVFDDSWLSVIRCERFFKQLQVLEAVYMCTVNSAANAHPIFARSAGLYTLTPRTVTLLYESASYTVVQRALCYGKLRVCLLEKFQPGSSSARVESLYDRQKR